MTLLTSTAMILLLQPAFAQTSEQPVQPEQMQVSEQDQTFATEAAQGGMLEMQLGELAVQNADSQEVKDFGQMMVDDHGKANQKLTELAEQKNLQLPQELSSEGQQHQQELRQLSGTEFDREYINLMIEDHQQDVASFQEQVQSGQDSDLVAFAGETLPVLQRHLDKAQQVQQQVVANTDQGQGQQQPSSPGQQAAALVGNQVLNQEGESIGEIEDVVLDQQQNAFAVVSVGGFLGIGEKNVAIPVSERPGQNGEGLTTAMSQADLEDLPAYEEGQYSSMFD
jgi:putative membrane protein